MPKVKTRRASCSSLSDYLGPGKELVPSQVPTLRAALQLALHLQSMRERREEVDKRNYPLRELISDVTTAVLKQWEMANDLFQPPITCHSRSMERRLMKEWERTRLAARNKLDTNQKAELEARLDGLLDPLHCTCKPILLCKETGCEGLKGTPPCKLGAHLPSCTCPREMKIPKLELLYVRSQRAKTSEKEAMQMGLADFKVEAKASKSLARREKERQDKDDREVRLQRKNMEFGERLEHHTNIAMDEQEEEGETDGEREEKGEWARESEVSQNRMDITRTAQASIRYGLSVRSTAAVTTAFLGDLIAAGELSPSKTVLAVDHSKLQRARDKLLVETSKQGEIQTKQDTIRNVMFDSRIDPTKVSHYDEKTERHYIRVEDQEHYTLTDGEGRYLTHLTKPGKNDKKDEMTDEGLETNATPGASRVEVGAREAGENTEKPKPAEVIARMIYEWIKIHGLTISLQFLACDSTNSNTGWRAGIVAWLEKLLGRKVTWLVCQLHTNELGLRHLFQKLDGTTNSKTGWSGPLGRLLKSVETMERSSSFKKITLGPELVELPADVLKDLSTDQSQLYQLVGAVRSGNLPRELALRKTGKMVHSRWLTFAEVVLLLWMSRHGLSGELLQRLEIVVTYIVSVYAPMWFNIKVRHSWVEGPRHVLSHLSLLKLQPPQVQGILVPYLRTSSWYAHSEAILQTMICSQEAEERSFAVRMILKLRGERKSGMTQPRPRKLPVLNTEATTLEGLIEWNEAHEPVLTCSLSRQDIEDFKDKPMEVPYFCGHTQPIERVIKQVTAACSAVFGEDRRDGWIRARVRNTETMPVCNTKRDLLRLLE